MKKKIQYLFYLYMCVSFSACITDYEPKGVDEKEGLLVVEGSITSGTSTILLSHSVGLTEELTKNVYINNARVWVECDDGNKTEVGTSSGEGKYIIKTGTLKANAQYRLRISLEGDEYESTFLPPLFTPEVDSVFYVKDKSGKPVEIYVSTHDPLDQSKYYSWSYKEVWELRADLFANARWIEEGDTLPILDYIMGGAVVAMNLSTANNRYYCWRYDNSKTLILDSSDKLKENIIFRKKLLEIPADDEKLSVLYYIEVEQKMVRKEAYDYLSNLQKSIDESGSIFAPVPSELRGNIKCSTIPDIPVIGYIDVATTVQKAIYIPFSWDLYEPQGISHCPSTVVKSISEPFENPIYEYIIGESTFTPSRICVDCRYKHKSATKERPSDWPNNHY